MSIRWQGFPVGPDNIVLQQRFPEEAVGQVGAGMGHSDRVQHADQQFAKSDCQTVAAKSPNLAKAKMWPQPTTAPTRRFQGCKFLR